MSPKLREGRMGGGDALCKSGNLADCQHPRTACTTERKREIENRKSIGTVERERIILNKGKKDRKRG